MDINWNDIYEKFYIQKEAACYVSETSNPNAFVDSNITTDKYDDELTSFAINYMKSEFTYEELKEIIDAERGWLAAYSGYLIKKDIESNAVSSSLHC
jgi:hypothetical protein